jgi:SWI/SNF-related matrix-associated actin-dependent regulator of chromatin subfamily A-like protein 1
VNNKQTNTRAAIPSDEVAGEALRRAAALADGLFPHQVEGLAFLLGRRRAILADDMGLGKTRQSIIAMREAAPEGPWLVVCPASVKRNWKREIEAALGAELSITVVGQRPVPAPEYRGWVVVNYDLLKKNIDALIELPWAGLIFDEAHYLKNHTSQRSKLGTRLVASAPGEPAVHCLTGTPLTNRPRDLFPLLQLVKHPLARSFFTFAKKYCGAYNNGFGLVTDGASNLQELTLQLHGVMLRRTKDQVLDLPPKIRTWLDLEVPLGTAAHEMRQVVELLVSGIVTQSSGGRRATTDRAAGRDRIKLLALLTKVRQKLAVSKVKQTVDFAQGALDQGEKVIVFTGFDAPAKAIADAFGDQAVLLTGATPPEQRQNLVDRFQTDPTVRVFVSNLIAGGTGVTLTAATQVVFNDLDWVPANHWQAEDRAYRIGQTRIVQVTYMVASGTVDTFVQRALSLKAAIVDAVVDGKALGDLGSGDILRDLEETLRQMSPGLADAAALEGSDAATRDPDWARRVVESAAEELRKRYTQADASDSHSATPSSSRPRPTLTPEIIEALANALSGPKAQTVEFASSKDPSKKYVVTIVGPDLDCTCPGFEYRGTCKHVVEVRSKGDRK